MTSSAGSVHIMAEKQEILKIVKDKGNKFREQKINVLVRRSLKRKRKKTTGEEKQSSVAKGINPMSLVNKDSTRLLGNKGTPCSSHWEREAGYSTWKQTQKSGLL